nr:MAG TPA: hypothetical protein [Caudoviricetes sp.]
MTQNKIIKAISRADTQTNAHNKKRTLIHKRHLSHATLILIATMSATLTKYHFKS